MREELDAQDYRSSRSRLGRAGRVVGPVAELVGQGLRHPPLFCQRRAVIGVDLVSRYAMSDAR